MDDKKELISHIFKASLSRVLGGAGMVTLLSLPLGWMPPRTEQMTVYIGTAFLVVALFAYWIETVRDDAIENRKEREKQYDIFLKEREDWYRKIENIGDNCHSHSNVREEQLISLTRQALKQLDENGALLKEVLMAFGKMTALLDKLYHEEKHT